MPDDLPRTEQALRQLRIGAQGIAAMKRAIEAPIEAQAQADRRREERSREHMRAALVDALAVQRRQMRVALKEGASEADIGQAIGMTEDQVRRALQ
jgi:hypothetical protein